MTTMTREEALTIVASIVREHSRECREPKPCQDCELEAEAIAALSAQEQEPWGWEWVDGSDTGVVTLRQDYEKYKRDYPRMTFTALYAAPPAQADTKQAEPLRVTREQLEAMVPTPYYYHHKMDEAATKIADSFNRCREMTLKNIADYFEAGAKVEVSDG